MIAAGSDAPAERGDPLVEFLFYAASYRHDLKDFAGADWHPEEAVSRTAALRMLTCGPAYAIFRKKELGTLGGQAGRYQRLLGRPHDCTV